jgi:hypothetical protein
MGLTRHIAHIGELRITEPILVKKNIYTKGREVLGDYV